MKRKSYIYILASQKNGILYTGVTNNLMCRVWEHKNKVNKGFTSKYKVTKLVYYEIFDYIGEAILREKKIKKWKRKWKIELIESINPYWDDLYDKIVLD